MVLEKMSKYLFTYLNIRRIASLSALSEEHRNFQKLCRDFAENELVPAATKTDRQKSYPKNFLKKMGDLGLMGVVVPKQYGGTGLDFLAYVIAVEEISRGCASMGLIVSVHNSMYLQTVLKWGNQHHLDNYVAPFTKGDKVGCFALTEPAHGSRITSPETTAKQNGQSYIINGIKAWIINSSESSAGIVFATTESPIRPHSLSAFIFPKPTKGLKLGALEDMMGLRGTTARSLIFDNCVVAKENLLGEQGLGYDVAMMTLNGTRVGVAAHSLGIAQASLDEAVRYSATRMAFGYPIFKLQAIQQKLADMALRIESARLLTWRAAWLQDNSKPFSKEASMAKLAASEAATFCSHQSMQIFGARGYSKNMPVERMYRDARATEIMMGTSEIQRIIIAMNIVKEYGF